MAPDPLWVALARAGLALVFAAAAWHKGRDAEGFARALRGHRLVPEAWSAPLALGLCGAEAAVAVALLLPASAPTAAIAAAALLALYSGAIGVNLARGRRDIDCGCAWRPRPLSGRLLARNALLGLGAGLAAQTPAPRALGAPDLAQGVAALVVLTMLWIAAGSLAALPASRVPAGTA